MARKLKGARRALEDGYARARPGPALRAAIERRDAQAEADERALREARERLDGRAARRASAKRGKR